MSDSKTNFVITSSVVTSKTGSYDWVVPSWSGRSARSQTITVRTATNPPAVASTVFIQSGSIILDGSNPATVSVESGAGSKVYSYSTNVAKLEFFTHYAPDTLVVSCSGVSSNVAFVHSSSRTVDRIMHYVTFTGDPGVSGSFNLFVTYSWGANTTANALSASWIYCSSGSYSSSICSITQNAGSGSIHVSAQTVVLQPSGGNGTITIQTNDAQGWTFQAS